MTLKSTLSDMRRNYRHRNSYWGYCIFFIAHTSVLTALRMGKADWIKRVICVCSSGIAVRNGFPDLRIYTRPKFRVLKIKNTVHYRLGRYKPCCHPNSRRESPWFPSTNMLSLLTPNYVRNYCYFASALNSPFALYSLFRHTYPKLSERETSKLLFYLIGLSIFLHYSTIFLNVKYFLRQILFFGNFFWREIL